MNINKWFAAALTLVVSCGGLRPSSAAIVGPYTPDANTVHLWHFDEAATTTWNATNRPWPQDAPGVLNPWRLDQAYSDSTYQGGFMGGPDTGYPGFGGAGALRIGGQRFEFRKGRTMFGTPPNGTTQSTRENSLGLLGSTAGPFTIEGLIKPQQTGAIIGCPSDDDPSQLTVSLQNTLANPTFAIGLPNSDNFTTTASIPGILPDTWYHWAVAFEGNNSGGSPAYFYWTKMEDSATTATLVQTFTSTSTQSYVTEAFQIGHWQGGFTGYIDQVRISNVARGSNDFAFAAVPEPSTVALGGGLAVCGLVAAAIRRRRR